MRANVFRDAGNLRCFTTSLPEHLGCDRLIGSPTIFRSRKQIGLRVHPAPVLTKRFEELWTERHITITVPLAAPNMNQHAYTVDICDLEITQLCSTHAGRVES